MPCYKNYKKIHIKAKTAHLESVDRFYIFINHTALYNF